MTDFTPQEIAPGRWTFEVRTNRCNMCKNRMVCDFPGGYSYVFPTYYNNNFEAQAKRAGFVLQSTVKVDGSYICNKCSASGTADFECSLCYQRHPTNEIEESFGDPPEHVCESCYSTVSAKEWDEHIGRLEDEHKYDFI